MDQDRANILIVDDSADNLVMLMTILAKAGYRAYSANNGKEALEILNKTPLDLVLLDVMMPDTDGFTILEEIRRRHSMIELPVIMLTAVSDNEHVVKALTSGANDYVTKPYDFSVIGSRIRTQITLKKTQEALKQSEERYSLAAQATMDGLWDWELDAGRVYYSPNWKKIIGYEPCELEDTPDMWFSRLHPADRNSIVSAMKKMQDGKLRRFEEEQRIIHRDGSYRWVITTGIAVPDISGRVKRLTGCMTDITDRRIYNALTGLPNQMLLLDQLERLLRQIKTRKRHKAALLFIDLDRFKLINQALGMVVGDAVLMEVAERLSECIRSDDILAHFGRDEFLLLVSEARHLKQITDIVLRIKGRVCEPIRIPQLSEEIAITSSIGVVIVDEKSDSVQKVLQDAESAMQRAKAAGVNNFRFYSEEMYREVRERMTIESRLRKAIDRDELRLYFQPFVNIAANRVFGAEVLVHWLNPEKGLVSPGQLIPLAEENGMIVPMGEWILHEACRQYRKWQEQGLMLSRIAVNLSPLQFSQRDLLKTLTSTIQSTGMDPKFLEIEITESHAMRDPENSIKIMRRLAEMGISISIDDFGTGYSSLSVLRQFPLTTLKIDRSFIQDVPGDPDAEAIVKTIIAMAQILKFEIIAEGVEDVAQLEFLREHGCRQYQGFLFSRSVPAIEFTRLLERERTTARS
ncbi:MAG: EAL domain-containing protein [Spirochaetaceae bacterium]|nr:MAG: EAL domain-containing protein [Spirochaetaceae bacterium]